MHHEEQQEQYPPRKGKVARQQQPRESRQQREPVSPNQYHLSRDISTLFASILRDGVDNSRHLPLENMLQLCETELVRLAGIKRKDRTALADMLDNELTVSIVGIQTRMILDEQHGNEAQSEKSISSHRSKFDLSRDHIIVRRHEGLVAQVDRNEAEIRKFMDGEVFFHQDVDFARSLEFFAGVSHKLRKFGGEKIVASRIRLLQVLTFFLREAVRKVQPDKSQQTRVEENISNGSIIYDAEATVLSEYEERDSEDANPHQSLSYDQVNQYSRFASKFLDEKMVQLSGVCEQVTQLDVFSRTLQFSQLEGTHRKAIERIVDVLLGLHNRVGYLSRRKPQLIKEFENAEQKLSFINERIEEFLTGLEEETPQIEPLSFTGLSHKWKCQLTEHFTSLQSHISRMSEVIIRQDNFHTHDYRKFECFVGIVELFSKVMSGDEAALEEWNELVISLQEDREVEGLSEDEGRLLRILNDCLSMGRSRYSTFREEQNQKTNRTNEELEVEVNKLIEDYDHMKQENLELANNLDLEQRLKEELLIEVDERDKIIRNLSAKKLGLEKKMGSQENRSVTSGLMREEEMKRVQHETQKYLERSLLLKEQLKVSQAEREQLMQAAEAERDKYLRTFETVSRIKLDKEQLEEECEGLRHQVDKLRNQNLRNINRLNNEKSLLEMQLDTAEKNNLRLVERLDLNEKKITEYSKLMMSRLDEKEDSSLPRLERENERIKKNAEISQRELKELEEQNKLLRDDVVTLKFRLKESQLSKEYPEEKEETNDLRTRLEKAIHKNQQFSRSLEEAKQTEEDLQEKLKKKSKRIKDLENNEKDFENERVRLATSVQDGERRYQDLQRELDELRHWAEKETRKARDDSSKRDLELLEKASIVSSLELKIRMLEEQLAHKSQQSERVTQELAETRMKQYESTIETHRLIELKLEEQNHSLKADLDEKVEVEIKLTFEIDRLVKEIDRMKAILDKYLRELTEKEFIIKEEREKLDEQHMQILEFEVREKVKKEQKKEPNTSTPHSDKHPHDYQTPSQFEANENNNQEPLSRSNMRYDVYFNARQYDRLKKEYNDFKKHASAKIEALQGQLGNSGSGSGNKGKGESPGNPSEVTNRKESFEITEKSEVVETIERAEHTKVRIQLEKTTIRLENMNNERQSMRNEIQRIKNEMQSMRRSNSSHQTKQTQLLSQIETLQVQLGNKDKKLAQEVQKQNSFIQEKQSFEERISLVVKEKETNSSSAAKEAELKIAAAELTREANMRTRETEMRTRETETRAMEAEMRTREAELRNTTGSLEATIKRLEGVNRELQENQARMQGEMEKEVKNMFNHYEKEMKRVISQTDEVNSRLTSENESLRKQLQTVQSSDQLDKEKEQKFNELKRSVESLLTEKNKLAQENTRVTQQLRQQDQNSLALAREVTTLKQKIEATAIQTQQFKDSDDQKRIDELAFQVTLLSKEKELIRGQYESMRKHLEEETKRAISLEAQLVQAQNSLRQELQKGRQGGNADYLNAKIRALNEALAAVGDELTDCKIALQNCQAGSIPTREVTDPQRQKAEWTQKEALYIQQLESMSREIVSLKDQLNKVKISERTIVTSLPQTQRPANSTYKEGGSSGNRTMGHIRVDKFFQGKKRWESIHFSESLGRWGVPPVVCQEVQDLRILFLSMGESILTLNQDQLQLEQRLASGPSMSNLLEYAFRILTFFSDVSPSSEQSSRIRFELESISKQHSGGYFFTVLEEYTIHLLQNNTIEEYKRELRAKANELLQIKQKLEGVINTQLEQEETMLNRQPFGSSRVRQPGNYTTSSFSSLHSSPAPR